MKKNILNLIDNLYLNLLKCIRHLEGERMHFCFNIFLLIFLTKIFLQPILLTGCNHQSSHQIVIINKLVTDMFEKIPDFFDINTVGAAPAKQMCPRDHQGIYNESFCLILDDKKFFNVISHRIKNSRNKEVHFKIKKDDGIIINQGNMLSKAIPAFNQNAHIITLLFPWRGYSIGTQFVAQNFKKTDESHSIIIPDFQNNTTKEDIIPNSMTTESLKNEDPKSKFAECMKEIIAKTVILSRYTIPYVWGGTSFITNHNDPPFFLNPDDGNWHLDRIDKDLPYSGFDCSGLIWRVLNMLGQINHPWRNTYEMAAKLKPVDLCSKLQNGDLLWFPGHIAVITNKDKGKIIEARGYSSGYGKVQKITLKEYFATINQDAQKIEPISDFATLFRNKKTEKPIYVFDSENKIQKEPLAKWAFLSITDNE